VNRAELIEVLARRLGTRGAAAAAVEGVLEEIQRAVARGERVGITGFGVFERRGRAARTARNPRTGEEVAVPATSVPAFRPGQGFREVVTGARRLPDAPAAPAPAVAEPAAAGGRGPASARSEARPVQAERPGTPDGEAGAAGKPAATEADATEKADAKKKPDAKKKADAKKKPDAKAKADAKKKAAKR